MGVPTDEELQQAIDSAIAMRERNEDPNFLAKCLLNAQFRLKLMDKLLHSTKLYLRSGQGSHEHSLLLKAIKEVESSSNDSSDQQRMGL